MCAASPALLLLSGSLLPGVFVVANAAVAYDFISLEAMLRAFRCAPDAGAPDAGALLPVILLWYAGASMYVDAFEAEAAALAPSQQPHPHPSCPGDSCRR